MAWLGDGRLVYTRCSNPDSPDLETELYSVAMDAKGAVVRRFSSLAAGEQRVEPSEPSMRGPMWERIGTPRIPAAAGHNRFTWDLTLAGPWDPNPGRSGRNGRCRARHARPPPTRESA